MGRKIMIIDDSNTIRIAMGIALRNVGYEVIEAENGKDALFKLDGREIDMFICDVNMPEMDGITCLKEIKNNASYASYRFTPFLMLTTEVDQRLIAEGREGGAKAWLIKPFHPDKLLNTVKKLMV